MPENLASFDDERTLMPKPELNKMSASKETPHTSLNAKKYDVTDDENDEEDEGNPFGEVYINEEATLDIPISELPNVIEEKKKKEDDGFKKEYAVRKETYATYICPIYFFKNNRGCIASMKSGSKTNKLSDEKHMHYLK